MQLASLSAQLALVCQYLTTTFRISKLSAVDRSTLLAKLLFFNARGAPDKHTTLAQIVRRTNTLPLPISAHFDMLLRTEAHRYVRILCAHKLHKEQFTFNLPNSCPSLFNKFHTTSRLNKRPAYKAIPTLSSSQLIQNLYVTWLVCQWWSSKGVVEFSMPTPATNDNNNNNRQVLSILNVRRVNIDCQYFVIRFKQEQMIEPPVHLQHDILHVP